MVIFTKGQVYNARKSIQEYRGELVNVIFPTTNIDQIVTNKIIKIYPTITDKSITIENPNLEENISIKIYSLSGRLIKKEFIYNNKCSLDVSELTNGLYFISIYQNNKRIMSKHLIIGPSKLIIQNLDSNLIIVK